MIMRKLNLFVLISFILINVASLVYAVKVTNIPRSELNLKAPDGWKFGVRGQLRDHVVKKYVPRHEDLFMWSQMLVIKHWFKERESDYDVRKRLQREVMKIKDQCILFSFNYDPTTLASPGAIAEYSCPQNLKIHKGQMGIIAFLQGKNGLYEVHWMWEGPYYVPKNHTDAGKIPLPVSDREIGEWYKYFSKIKLQKD